MVFRALLGGKKNLIHVKLDLRVLKELGGLSK